MRGDTGKRPSVTPDSRLAVVFFSLLLNLQSADNRSAVERETRGWRGVKRERERWGGGREEVKEPGYD